jgi:hypothetical protein
MPTLFRSVQALVNKKRVGVTSDRGLSQIDLLFQFGNYFGILYNKMYQFDQCFYIAVLLNCGIYSVLFLQMGYVCLACILELNFMSSYLKLFCGKQHFVFIVMYCGIAKLEN